MAEFPAVVDTAEDSAVEIASFVGIAGSAAAEARG